eukprot:4828696-Pleurochrysis_carterae.AAC.1
MGKNIAGTSMAGYRVGISKRHLDLMRDATTKVVTFIQGAHALGKARRVKRRRVRPRRVCASAAQGRPPAS